MSALRSQVENDTRQVSSFFADMVKFEVVKQAFTGLVGLMRGAGADALTAVKDFESLNLSMRQLTATSLVQAGVTDDMREALRLAEEPAAELVTWIEKLAKLSPLDDADVARMVQMGLAFNFSVSEAKRLTQALVDFSSGTGRGAEVGNRLMLSLGQMAAKGKITGEELREMASAGLPALQILAKGFGLTTSQMQKMIEGGTVPAGKALTMITEYLERNFAGAAERTAQTWQGLLTSLNSVKNQDLRALFGGVFEAIRPEFANLVDFLGSAEFQGRLKAIGADLGESLKGGITLFKAEFAALNTAGMFDGLKADLKALGGGREIVDLQSGVRAVTLFIGDAIVEGKAFGESFAAYTATDTAAIIDFVQTSIAQLKLLWDAGERILTLFGAIGKIGSTVAMLTPQNMASNPFGFQQALKDLGSLQNEIATIKTSWNDLGSVQGELEQSAAGYAARQVDRQAALMGQVAEITAQHDKEKAALAGVAVEYDKVLQGERDRRQLRTAVDPITLMPASYADDKKAVKEGLETSKALERNTWTNLGDTLGDKAGESFAKKAASILESAIDAIRSPIQSAINDAKKLIPGYKEPGAPGTNQWAEDIYRIIDVAQNLNTPHEGQDTRKWYQKFYDGMGFPEAVNLARGTQDKFLAGDLMAPNVRPYLDDVKLRALLQQQAKGGAGGGIDEYAKVIGTDPATLAALLKSGGKATDAEIAALTKGGAPAVAKKADAAAVTAAAKGGADAGLPAPKEAIKGLLEDFDKEIVASADATKGKGAAFWKAFEDGLIAAATNSGALWGAVNSMVTTALAAKIPA